MKLYRHYKNKPYTFVGLAKHTETEEEMVIYETRYDSPGGRVWVRPSAMFHESVEIHGDSIPRFRKIPLELESFAEISKNELEAVAAIARESLEQWDEADFIARLELVAKPYLLLAFVEGACAGFKLGYELDNAQFYSWLGGVRPEFQGLSIAADLMRAQHDWCRRQGYQKIRTKTQNCYRKMLILNVSHGFDVIGTEVSDRGLLKILMEKNLRQMD